MDGKDEGGWIFGGVVQHVLWTHYYQPNKIGQDTVWHSAKYPSALTLPVME